MTMQNIAVFVGMLPIVVVITVFMMFFVISHTLLGHIDLLSRWAVTTLSICTACISTIIIGPAILALQASGNLPEPGNLSEPPVLTVNYDGLASLALIVVIVTVLLWVGNCCIPKPTSRETLIREPMRTKPRSFPKVQL